MRVRLSGRGRLSAASGHGGWSFTTVGKSLGPSVTKCPLKRPDAVWQRVPRRGHTQKQCRSGCAHIQELLEQAGLRLFETIDSDEEHGFEFQTLDVTHIEDPDIAVLTCQLPEGAGNHTDVGI